MTTKLLRLVPGSVLTAVAAVYYTAPAGTRAVVRSATLTNTTAGVVACTVYVVPSSGAVAAANTIVSARNLSIGETYNLPELVNQVIEPGSTIQALGLGVSFMASGAEVT